MGKLVPPNHQKKRIWGPTPNCQMQISNFTKFPSYKPIKVGQASFSAILPWIYQTSLKIKFAFSLREIILVHSFSLWVYLIVLIPHTGLADREIISKLHASYNSSSMIPFPSPLTFCPHQVKAKHIYTAEATEDRGLYMMPIYFKSALGSV